MAEYRVASDYAGVVSVPGRVYRPGESIPAHLVGEELLASGAVVAVDEPEAPRKKGSR